MTRRHRAAALGLVAALFTTGVAAPVHAQSEGQLAVARKFYQDGLAAEKAKDWLEAVELYEKALDIKQTPQLLLRAGICYEQLGRLTKALDAFERGAERARLDDQQKVEKVLQGKLEALRPKVPTLTVTVTDPPEGLVVEVDGEEVATAALGTALPIDPGEHQLEASAPRHLAVRKTVTITEGNQDLTLTLELDPNAPKEGPAPVPSAPSGSSPMYWPGGLAVGIGVAGLAVGGALIGVAQGKEGDVDDRCGGPERLQCPVAEQADIESELDGASSLRLGGFIAGGVGAAALVAGVVLLVLPPEADTTSETGWTVTPTWSPGYGGFQLDARF